MEPTPPNPPLDSFLRDYEGPCPHCGFHLKRTSSSRCPECGSKLELTLKEGFKCSSWMLFLFGIVCSIGVCIDQAGLFFAARIYNGSPLMWRWVLPELVLIVLLLIGLLFWWKLRRWILGLNPALRWVIGFIGVLMPIVLFNVLFWIFTLTF